MLKSYCAGSSLVGEEESLTKAESGAFAGYSAQGRSKGCVILWKWGGDHTEGFGHHRLDFDVEGVKHQSFIFRKSIPEPRANELGIFMLKQGLYSSGGEGFNPRKQEAEAGRSL